MLSLTDIVKYFNSLTDTSILEYSQSTTIQNCYQHYKSLNGILEELEKELIKINLALWMFTLVCCQSDFCNQTYSNIVNTKNIGNELDVNNIPSILKSVPQLCPPNCDCDNNPWPFLEEK